MLTTGDMLFAFVAGVTLPLPLWLVTVWWSQIRVVLGAQGIGD